MAPGGRHLDIPLAPVLSRRMNDLAIEEAHGHVVPYGTFITVWGILVALTLILTFVSKVFHEALSVWAMLTITPLKAGLVFYYFMHLKFDSRTYARFFITGIAFALTLFMVGLISFRVFAR